MFSNTAYTCTDCQSRWSQTPKRACLGRSKLSTTARLWALKSVVIDKMSIHVIATNLSTSWNTVCTAVLDLGRTLLIADATRFDGVSTIAAYAAHPSKGKKIMGRLIDTLAKTIPDELKELRSLRTTFQRRRADILAYFDHWGTSNGPTEAINGRLEHLRGIALGFRNRSNYLLRSLLHAGGLATLLQPYL